jgi:hypothetical protein
VTSNLRRTLEAVEQNPQHWDQRSWHCGTSHCFGGFAEMIRLERGVSEECVDAQIMWCPLVKGGRHLISWEATRAWLGLNTDDWARITRVDNTLRDLRRIVNEIEPEPVSA